MTQPWLYGSPWTAVGACDILLAPGWPERVRPGLAARALWQHGILFGVKNPNGNPWAYSLATGYTLEHARTVARALELANGKTWT